LSQALWKNALKKAEGAEGMQNPLDAAWAGGGSAAMGGLEGAWGDAGAAMAQQAASPGYVFAERDAEIAAAIAAESGGDAFAAGMAYFERGQLKQVGRRDQRAA
jgi:hypothetical protein